MPEHINRWGKVKIWWENIIFDFNELRFPYGQHVRESFNIDSVN